MNNKVMELLNNQMEARNVLALEIVNEAKEALKALGLEELLNNDSVITKTVEVEKKVEVEKIVEKIVEVEVEKKVEVIIESEEDKRTIAELKKELENYKKTVAKLQKDLDNQKEMYTGVIGELNAKLNGTNKSKSIVHKEVPVQTELPEDLKINKNFDKYVMGTYKNIPFEACKNMEATTLYNPTKWDMKDELNKMLADKGLINPIRTKKDIHRVECEFGACHEISVGKYMGYVVVDTQAYTFVYDTEFEKGSGYITCKSLNAHLKNPKSPSTPCTNKRIVTAVNNIIAMHNENVVKFNTRTNDAVYGMLGINADGTSITPVTNTTSVANDTPVANDTVTPVVNTTVTPVTTNEELFQDTSDAVVIDHSQENEDILNFGWN